MPGKLRAIEKWETPKTILQLRGFLWFTNYYSVYIDGYAKLVSRLQDKLKVPRGAGKKGSRVTIEWSQEDQEVFDELKKRMCDSLVLNRMDPDKPFVLRTDASGFAVGAVLEQLTQEKREPTLDDVLEGRTEPVGFMSRKLTGSQKNWTPREQETYAIILALKKWVHIIGHQPVLVVTDHKSLEDWTKETLDTLAISAKT